MSDQRPFFPFHLTQVFAPLLGLCSAVRRYGSDGFCPLGTFLARFGQIGFGSALLLLAAALRFQSLPPLGFYQSLQVWRTPGKSEKLLGQRGPVLKPPTVAPPSSNLRRLSDRQQVLFSPHHHAELGGR